LERARAIRAQQKPLIADRSSSRAVAAAVRGAHLERVLEAALGGAGAASAVASWPSAAVSTACFEALLQLYLQGSRSGGSREGSSSRLPLSPPEVQQLLAAVASYRKRGPAPFTTKLARALNLPGSQTKLSGQF
jgi:hypothetical protein